MGVDSSRRQPAADTEQSPVCPSAQSGRIGAARWILAVWRGLLNGITGGDALTGLFPATQREGRRRREPIRQNRKGLPARTADSAAHPGAFVPVIVGLAEPSSMPDDRVALANRASPREKVQRDHPGSLLSLVSGSAIKRITAGVKARRDRPCQVSISWSGLHPPD